MKKNNPDTQQGRTSKNNELNSSHVTEDEKKKISAAVEIAINNYVKSRKKRIPWFVKRHFSFRGSLVLHRKALGRDLLRSPVNVIWAVPYTLSVVLAAGLRAGGWKDAAKTLDKLPRGFETDMQKEVKWLIYTDLLELPYSINNRSSDYDALLVEILKQPAIQNIVSIQLSRIHEKSLVPNFRSSLETKIREYTYSRTAAEDLSGSILTLVFGYMAFKKFSPGAISSGAALATAITQHMAISNFLLGPAAGARFYAAFPVTPSRHMFLISTASIMAALAIITTFSGILTDPLQASMGIHQKRLQKLVSSLEQDLRDKQNKQFRIKDQYVARVFDIVDLLKAAAMA